MSLLFSRLNGADSHRLDLETLLTPISCPPSRGFLGDGSQGQKMAKVGRHIPLIDFISLGDVRGQAVGS